MRLINLLSLMEKGDMPMAILYRGVYFEYDAVAGDYISNACKYLIQDYVRTDTLSDEVQETSKLRTQKVIPIEHLEPTAVDNDGQKYYDYEVLANKIDELVDVINEMRCIK